MADDIKFVHLHVHSQYSLLDGQASIQSLVDRSIEMGMPGIALTDHGNMFGVKEMFNYCNKVNGKRKAEGKEPFKPIFGCEVYIVPEGTSATDPANKHKGHHLIILAKNKTGYKNLVKIVSRGYTDGFYQRARTDMDTIAAHREGLIVASACIGGEVPQRIRKGDIEGALAHAAKWKELMGDDYYIELQKHPTDKPGGSRQVYEIQKEINPHLVDIARKLGIKLICTNDVHFTNEDDGEAHDRLICISTNNFVTDADRMHYTKQEWLKSPQQMAALFSEMPEALATTVEICDKVETYSIDHAPIMPFFEIPAEFGTEEELRSRITEEDLFNEFTRDENGNIVMDDEAARKKIDKLGGYDKLYRIKFEADYLGKLAYEGARRRYGDPLPDDIDERIRFELHIMKTMGFPGYFLIVQDFIAWARAHGVSVGPGRGSAAGSCVAYCLGITQVDPLKYDLLFERFLNPDRISLPDIDIDFDDDGRELVLNYVTKLYGAEKVAHIITFGTMAAKSAIKDVARVEQLPLSESNRLANLVPDRMPQVDGKELKCNLKNCYQYVPEFRDELTSPNPLVRETLDFARRLEGNVRNTGVHACGVIICRDDITDWVPIYTIVDKASASKERVTVTQYEGSIIEDTGLIKMDFLGLKTLSIIKEALHNIKLRTGEEIDIDNIPIDDPETYKLYSRGDTVGTFQFESVGMRKSLKELQPTCFEDLIAMNALFRPGPMDYIPDFIARKHGVKPIEYDIAEMEKYLKDTYGITVYQEQVMLLSRQLAGFTRGESDTLRKAMGKKLKDKMDALKVKFMAGGQERGHQAPVLEKIWADWEKFASYAFNKSHATCYSWVAYQTGWLKAHYPAEYMAAVMTRNRANAPKLVPMMDECKRMKITIKGPDVNESFTEFGVTPKGDIRFGLAAVKGVGDGVVEAIIEARSQGGPFQSIFDFVERVPSGSLNRRIIEALAMAGAFDCFSADIRREDFFEPAGSRGDTFSEALMRYAQAWHVDKQQATMSLFGDDDSMDMTAGRPDIPKATPWPDTVRLDKERELVGMYLSAHPLDPYYMEINYGCTHTVKSFTDAQPEEGKEVSFAGMVLGIEQRTSRAGNPYSVLKIEDYTGTVDMMLFGQQFYDYQKYGIAGTPVMVTGKWERRYENSDVRFNITRIDLLDNVKGNLIKSITIDVADTDLPALLDTGLLDEHLDAASADGNNSAVTLFFSLHSVKYGRRLRLASKRQIRLSRALCDQLAAEDVHFSVR